MDLSPNEIAEIKEVVEETARALHTAHLTRGEGSLAYFMSFCDEDVFAIGTGLEEVIESKERLQTFIEQEWQEMPRDIHHRIHSVHVQVLSRESAYAHTFLALNMNEDGEGDFIEVRFSTMLVKQEDDWKVIGWHGMRARDHGFQAEIKREFDPQAGELKVMPQELGRVVLNLPNNAFNAIKTQDGAEVTLTSSRSADGMTITGSDNGPGIPEDIREKIFEPFFTTKATGEGTGLGLSLSYEIITKGHEGAMRAEDAPGGGACFVIEIPA